MDRPGPDVHLPRGLQALTETLEQFYTRGYTAGDRAEAQRLGAWRALGARGKADHVAALLARAALRPGPVVEIGCGDGALLTALSQRGIGAALDGFELSGTAIELARSRALPGARRLEAYDGEVVPAAGDSYDLAILSHVLEHVPRPARLLAEAARIARWVLVEVPLEDNRSARRPAKRAQAQAIGHIQRFARADVRALICGAGLEPVAQLSDPLPRAQHAFFAAGARERASASAKWALRHAAWRLAPGVAERAFTVHYAVLARRSA